MEPVFESEFRRCFPDMAKLLGDLEIFEMLIRGVHADQVQARLDRLTAEDRQAVLCTACFLMPEIKATCPERAQEIADFIEANCAMPCSGRKVCGQNPSSVRS